MGDRMTKEEKNVLEAIVEQTIVLRGKNKGRVKRRIPGDSYFTKALVGLTQKGLIDYEMESVYGRGYAATKAGFREYV
jgi:hypothetical protein